MPTGRGLKVTTIVVFLVLTGHGMAARATVQSAGDRSLQSALKSLQAAGLNLVFTDTLVADRYQVADGPDPHTPLAEQAAELLTPFGLGLERAGSNLWYVVRVDPEPDPALQPPDARPSVDPTILEEVLVSSSRYPIERDTHDHRRLDAHELALVPSAGRDVLRAVSQLPGQASNGVSARSHIRGGNTNEVLYLVDGIQIVEPFHMGDFHAPFSTINPGLVDSVNVYQAGFPAAFGSRLSGVVDMELTEAEKPLEGRVNVDFVDAASQAEGQAGDTRWLVSARRSTLDQMLGYVEQDYGHPKFQDQLMRVAWEGDDSDLVLGMLHGSDELTLHDSKAGETANADYSNLTTWARASHTLNDRLDVELAGSYTAVDNRRQGRLDDPVDAVGSLEETRDFTVASLRSGLRWRPVDRWLVHAGVEAQHQSGDFEVAIASRYGLLGQSLQPAPVLERDVASDREGVLMTAFVSAQQKLTPTVTVEYGWRYDLQDIAPLRDHQLSPRIQVTYDSGGAWRAFVNAGRYAQHQNLYELQLDDGLLELNAPQISDQLSVGTDWSANDRWRLGLEAYWRRIDDPWRRFDNVYNAWVLLPELHADRINLTPQEARTYGGEATIDYTPTDNLRWSLSMALARAEERLSGEWQPRPWEQQRTVRGDVSWEPANWRIGIAVTYHSGWPTTSLMAEPFTTAQLYDATLPDYLSLDIHTARRFELRGSEIEVYFDLSNATFSDNVGGYRYALGSSGLVREQRDLLPAVPVLGLSWSW